MMPFSADSVRPELIIISASDEDALVAEMNRLIAFIDRLRDVSLVDIAYTCSFSKGGTVISIIATSVQDLRSRLSSAVSRISSGQVKRLKDKSGTYYFREHLLGGENGGKLAFVYPGVMSYYPDMMRDMAIIFPECRAAFDELEEALSGDKNFTPSNFIFPPAPYYKHDADIFSAGAYAQALVSVFAASVAMTRLFSRFGLSPDGIVGCAGGDLAAVMASGAAGDDVSRPDRVRFIRDIYKIVDKAVDHAGLPETPMITALPRQAGDVEQVLSAFNPKDVILALDFSPRLKTYAVRKECVDDFVRALTTAGIRSLNLALDRPFNTALCSSMVPAVRKFVGIWMKHKPSCEVFSCATAEILSPKPRKARDDTAERWSKPVRFTDTILAMHEAGYKVFLEVGPRGLMTSAIEETLKGKSFAAIATNSIHRRGILQALHAIAQLAALGAPISVSSVFARRQAKKLDFDAAISMEVRRFSEMRLSRLFPKMTLTGGERKVMEADFTPGVQARGAKAAMRAAALAERNRRVRQFDFGVVYPMLSDADEISSSPGISCELSKTFTLEETPFIGDFSYGSSQLSYSDPNLRGLVMLAIPVAVEIMAEAAVRVMPKRHLAAIEDFVCRRQVKFEKGRLALTVHAERTAAADPRGIAVKVQLRNDMPNAEYTWPIMEATFILAEDPPHSSPQQVDGLSRPRSVHWSGRDIYPSKLGFGPRLRGIVFAELWGEGGLDYEVAVPKNANCVSHTHFPIWAVNPLLMQVIVSGFTLWRRHERFAGAFSYPCRFRRMELKAALPAEGSKLNCYLRLTGVTPRSHLCDITVTSGDGNEVIKISGWEEITDRVPQRYCEMILQPATSFITESLSSEALGDPATDVSSAFVTDVPYPLFEKDEEFWLKIMSHVVLNHPERKEFSEMSGSTRRRTEWLFGRIAAKEAVRRYLKDFYQARWSYADVQIWPDANGKPIAIGDWNRYLLTRLDIAIAHTSQFVIAVAAANARVGVDVESVSRDLSDEFARGVFIGEELDLAASTSNPSQAIIRFWCAKEAVSKALGTGIRYSPREMVVTSYLADTGDVTMKLTGAWEEAFKELKGKDIRISTRIMRDHALAFCFIPNSLFPSEGE